MRKWKKQKPMLLEDSGENKLLQKSIESDKSIKIGSNCQMTIRKIKFYLFLKLRSELKCKLSCDWVYIILRNF